MYETHVHLQDGARRAQKLRNVSRQCALWCFMQLFRNVLKVVQVVREDVRSFAVAICVS